MLDIQLLETERTLLVTFPKAQQVLSWALYTAPQSGPYRDGLCLARRVAWVLVNNAELPPDVDPQYLLRDRLAQVDATDAIGLLTSRDLSHYVVRTARQGDEQACCVATVGLSNALRCGDPPGPLFNPAGTINLLCWTSVPLDSKAMYEALSVVTEARTVAVHETKIPSRVSGQPASGTGTDCTVLATPRADLQPNRAEVYAGKHTAVGHILGKATYEAVRDGARAWLQE